MRIKLVVLLNFIVAPFFLPDLSAQVKEVEEMWKKQMDTSKISLLKPMHLSVTEDKVKDLLNRQPDFGLYKDNYFITGVPIDKSVNDQTADAKFQISIRQRLFNAIMPFNTQLLLIYTQKSFWDIYKESFPFYDNNYNPGLLLTRPIIHKKQMKGMVSFSLEHESNGKDSIENRSWNYFTISGTHFLNYHFYAQVKLWYGWLDDDNSDLFDYRGYGLVALNFRNKNDKLTVSLLINPIKNFSANTQLDFTYRLNKKANQSLFIQWYNGYGESLLDYNQYTSMIRIGMCIKSPLRNIY